MAGEPRTKKTALDTLEAMRQDVIGKIEDHEIGRLLSAELVRAIFNEAWRLQLEDDAPQFMRAARDLVLDAANQSATEGRK